jgi:hypothetical protein
LRCEAGIVRARSFLLAAFLATGTLTSARAHAMGAVVSSPPGSSSTTDVRIAVSSTGTRTSRWVSLHVHGTATAFAWVIPVKPSAFVDLTSDAWLESLEDATAPRVVPPEVPPPCGEGGVEVDGELSHVVTSMPDSVATAADAPTLTGTLAGWGLAVTDDLAPLVDAAGADGDSFVALLYSTGSADVVTRTVRIVDTSSPTIPLALTSGTSNVTVTAYAFSTGEVTFGASPALALDPATLLWLADGSSTYAPVRDTLLTTNPGAWLVESAGNPELFDGEPVPGAGSIPALAPTYFSRAWTYGDATGAPATCTAASSAIAESPLAMAVACPAGSLAHFGDPSCVEAPADGELPPDDLRCGGIADDLAIALSGMAPAGAWLTRARSVLAANDFGSSPALVPDANASPAGPVIACSGYGETCGGTGGGGPPTPPGGTSSSSGGAGGSGGGNSDPGGGNSVGSTVGNVLGAALDASSSTDDGCDGDSSDDGGDSCSSDGGDASGGDDCSGDSSPDCTIGRPRGRAPTSRFLLLVVALAAAARRRGRHSPSAASGEGPASGAPSSAPPSSVPSGAPSTAPSEPDSTGIVASPPSACASAAESSPGPPPAASTHIAGPLTIDVQHGTRAPLVSKASAGHVPSGQSPPSDSET